MATNLYPIQKSIRPSVNVETNTDNMNGSSSETDKQLMLIGMARGGEPNKIYKITTYADAKSIFRGGDLLDAIEVALSPNATTHSGTIFAQRVGAATQATYENKGLKFTSNAYSSDANNIQTSLVKNTLNGTYNLTVNFDMDRVSRTYANLGKVFSIYYTGTQQYADVSIETDVDVNNDGENHTGLATKLILKAGADKASASVVKEFLLGQGYYTKVAKLIENINYVDGFNSAYFYSGNKNIDTKYLDAVDAQEISKEPTSPTFLTSLGGDIVNTLTMEADATVSATYDPSKGEPTAYEFTSLTGGSSSELPPTSWAKEIQNFATVEGYYLVPVTDDLTVQIEAKVFCENRNKEADPRALIVGGGINDSINATMQRARTLRTRGARVLVNACSGSRNMNNGTTPDLPAYIIAAQIGGLATGLPMGESITFKTLGLVDVDQKFTKEELDLLDQNGAIGIEFVRNRGQVFRITNDITTARLISEDAVETELGVGESNDFIVTGIRAELENKFIGTSTSLSAASDIKTCIIGLLQQYQNNGIIVDYSESNIHVLIHKKTVDINIACVLARSIKEVNVHIIYVDEELRA